MTQIPFRMGTFDLTTIAPLESEISKLEKQLTNRRNQCDILSCSTAYETRSRVPG